MSPNSRRKQSSASARSGRRRRWVIRAAISLVVATCVLSVLSIAVGHYSRQLAADLAAKALPILEAKTGLHITFSEIKPSLRGHSVLRDVVVQSSHNGRYDTFARIPKLEILHKISLSKRTLVLTGIRLDRPSFVIELYPDGLTNMPDLLARLTAPTAEGSGEEPSPRSKDVRGLARALLGGASDLNIYVRGGAVMVRDMGRYHPAEPIIVSLHDATADLGLNLDRREISLRGSAQQTTQNGRVYFETTVDGERSKGLVRLTNMVPNGLVRFAPSSLKISPDSKFSGRLQFSKQHANGKYYLSLAIRVESMDLSHPRLAANELQDVCLGCEGQVILDLQQRSLITDDLILRLGRAPFHLIDTSFHWPRDGDPSLSTTIQAQKTPLQDILDGLPKELTPIIHGAKAEGNLDLTLKVNIDMAQPRKSGIEVSGSVTDFQPVFVPARCDVRRLKESAYQHLARKYGLLQRTIVLGPSNKSFVPGNAVGYNLRSAVLVCEDGGFFRHHGFLLKHINESLRQNLREKRFARGASTITMQLVKNLYLSEDKTISRKLQEMMLTWWIEKEISKQRMFEIYMNIIEWGPKIYGCGAAARHYFHRHPSRLSVTQAAWMASIISNPRRFYYMKARAYVGDGYKTKLAFIISKMINRGALTEEEFAELEEENFPVYFGSQSPETKKPDEQP